MKPGFIPKLLYGNGQKKNTIKLSVAKSIAEVSWFIESKGMEKTAEAFSDSVYDFIEALAISKQSYQICKDPKWARLGFKCVNYTSKYTIVMVETEMEITICEFIASKMIWCKTISSPSFSKVYVRDDTYQKISKRSDLPCCWGEITLAGSDL